MDKRTYRCISSVIIFKSLFAILLFQSTLSAPINSTISYDTFLKNITRDNCAFPSGIVLPFQDSLTTFNYFSDLLKICKAPEAMKRSLEAITLCNEIYDALKNITCHSDKNVYSPEIKIEFSDNVCDDINSLQLQHLFKEKSLLLHLTDKFICVIMCEDEFLPACKMLLWSFQLQKRIDGIRSAQPILNTSDQENNNAGNDQASVTKISSEPNPEDPAEVKVQQSIEPNQDLPAGGNLDSNNKVVDGQPIVNDDTDKNGQDPSLKNSHEQNVEGENEIPEESNVNEIKDNDLDGKEDPSLKPDKQNEIHHQLGNEAPNTKVETGTTKTEGQTPPINNQPIKENKIDVDEEPSKLIASNPEKTVLKNKPVVPVPEQVKAIGNKTELKKETTNIQNNIQPIPQKESPAMVKPVDTTNGNDSSKNLKPTIPEIKNPDKLQDTVFQPPTPPKTSSIGVNEAKVTIKSEAALPKDEEITDTKVIPTIGKEDVVSVTTVADLEKMEEGNGIPEPAEKDQDLYNDMESEGEYSKIEYDEDGFYDSPKNKKPEESDSGKISKPALAENESPKYDVFPQRNSFGRGPDDIQVIPAFPEQEDSHFFFYFLSLVLILMAGYILFHNKQKIIALIVEGRHERRRRSHGLGYKKLETK